MRSYLILHIAALLIGYAADLIIGDPHGIPHPVAWIGNLIGTLESALYPKERDPGKEIRRGCILCVIVTAVTVLVTIAVLLAAYRLHPFAGAGAEAVLTCYILAAGSLRDESMKVFSDLQEGDIRKARSDLSMIVGRDTEKLEKDAVIRAAVETVAENTSDGVIAPLLFTAIGGPAAGLLYKAVNTMDSMLGYRNDRYEYFGKAAAKLDDAANFLPSRISAMLMIAASFFPGKLFREFDGGNAFKIWRRDRYAHKSPNSAQTESVCAGALGIRLGGPNTYGGVLVEKPYIGEESRPIRTEDIRLANRLMFAAEGILPGIIIAAAAAAFAIVR